MIRKGSKNKFQANIKYENIYNHYIDNSNSPVDRRTHSRTTERIFGGLMELMIKEGFSLTFPSKFGKMEIQKRKQKITYNEDGSVNRIHYKIDWNATKKHWSKVYGDITPEELKNIKNKPKVYCKNKYRMSFKYLKNSAQYKSKSVVMFIPSRKWCRELASHLKNNPYQTDYKEQ